ncbi:hypothetical protein SAMN05216338_1001281 [Bradyrhizobium sp. Rc2d]|uniref:hypothetical protein n=1 Tax=Bradyrhizobium sp. Rc2d TaxID=1855321 RepID=UPI0008893F72|nr:hypothetical protein [Bradyrhizobium sp. Rc2d]SDG43219.1 hypothetical protein SAMN05216338_1001281 [Bradyrhizobium sp. Rc2d]
MQIGIEIAKAEDRDGFVVDDDGIIRGGTGARAADRCALKLPVLASMPSVSCANWHFDQFCCSAA